MDPSDFALVPGLVIHVFLEGLLGVYFAVFLLPIGLLDELSSPYSWAVLLPLLHTADLLHLYE